MANPQIIEFMRICLTENRACIVVRVIKAKGSTPRDEGAFMCVSASSFAGTVGGGQLEWLVLNAARKMLSELSIKETLEIPLGPEINQCCGGHMTLSLNFLDEHSYQGLEIEMKQTSKPHVLIFGAGHTGKALAQALLLLPFDIVLIDSRAEIIESLNVEVATLLSPMPEQMVRDAPAGSAIVVLTHSHDLDFLITAEALSRDDLSYCGMIGSKTKRAVFANWLAANDYDTETESKLVCPIGGKTIRDKRPEIIAALVAAELISTFNPA